MAMVAAAVLWRGALSSCRPDWAAACWASPTATPIVWSLILAAASERVNRALATDGESGATFKAPQCVSERMPPIRLADVRQMVADRLTAIAFLLRRSSGISRCSAQDSWRPPRLVSCARRDPRAAGPIRVPTLLSGAIRRHVGRAAARHGRFHRHPIVRGAARRRHFAGIRRERVCSVCWNISPRIRP